MSFWVRIHPTSHWEHQLYRAQVSTKSRMVNAGVPLGCDLYGSTSGDPVGAVPVGFVSRLIALLGCLESTPHRKRSFDVSRVGTNQR